MAVTFYAKVAGMQFTIHTMHEYSRKLMAEYCVDTPGEHVLHITQDDIDHERQLVVESEDSVDQSLATVPDFYLESIAVLRKMADYVCEYNRLLMHGSAIAIDGKGYIFTALSGTGKSTHTALLRKLHGENAVMINDDKPFLYLAEDKIYVCGSPWMGKHGIGSNISVPLEGIFFLRRSEDNVLEQLSAENALTLLVSQCHRPVQADKMMFTLDLLDQVLTRVPLYDFGCNMDISAAELSTSVMK